MVIAVFVLNLAVDLWLLTILYRQGVRKQMPWFVLYIAWGFVSAGVALVAWGINPELYVTAYWWMEGVQVAFTVGAVRESFQRALEGMTAEPGVRRSVWGVIGVMVLYSGWKAIYAPPVQSSRLIAFIVGAEFAFRWGIVGICVLTMFLMWWSNDKTKAREDAVVTGFGVISGATLLNIGSRSLFGTKFIFLTKYLPSVGYFMAAWLWIRVFSRPAPKFGFKELGMEPEAMAQELGRYREILEWFRRLKW